MPGATNNFKLPIALGSDLYNHLTIDNAASEDRRANVQKSERGFLYGYTH